jgi:hypothetical protein
VTTYAILQLYNKTVDYTLNLRYLSVVVLSVSKTITCSCNFVVKKARSPPVSRASFGGQQSPIGFVSLRCPYVLWGPIQWTGPTSPTHSPWEWATTHLICRQSSSSSTGLYYYYYFFIDVYIKKKNNKNSN